MESDDPYSFEEKFVQIQKKKEYEESVLNSEVTFQPDKQEI